MKKNGGLVSGKIQKETIQKIGQYYVWATAFYNFNWTSSLTDKDQKPPEDALVQIHSGGSLLETQWVNCPLFQKNC